MAGCSKLKLADCPKTKGCEWVVGKGCKASVKKTKTPEKKTITKTNGKKPKVKEAPPEHDPLRRFYVSLLKEKPGSKMAQAWCAERCI